MAGVAAVVVESKGEKKDEMWVLCDGRQGIGTDEWVVSRGVGAAVMCQRQRGQQGSWLTVCELERKH